MKATYLTALLRRLGHRACGVLLLAAMTSATACESLLEVETPSRIPAEALEQPVNANLLVQGAVADFECAFGAYVVLGGLIGDELIDATQTANRFPYDRRNMQPNDTRYAIDRCDELGVYTPLQAARSSADNILDRLQDQWTDAQVPNRTGLIAKAAAYGGYSYLLLAEGFCSSVVSTIGADRQPVYGAEISRDSVFRLAESRFTTAIQAAQAADSANLLNMALVGRARTRMHQGNYAAARADAAQVPAGFVRDATTSGITARRNNRVWTQSSAAATSVSVGEMYRNLNDPRIPVHNRDATSTTGVALWEQRKYTGVNSPIPIARAAEAQLIVAEVAARVGELGTANAILATFRAAGNQPPFVGITQEQVLAEIIDQRRRALFLESQHLGDMIRFNLPLVPAPGTPYHGGGIYGDQLCLPLPDIERRNNPNLTA